MARYYYNQYYVSIEYTGGFVEIYNATSRHARDYATASMPVGNLSTKVPIFSSSSYPINTPLTSGGAYVGGIAYFSGTYGVAHAYYVQVQITIVSDGYVGYNVVKGSGQYRERTPIYSRGSLIESNIIAEDGTYPVNGRHSDNRWYVRGAALPTYTVIFKDWDGTTLSTQSIEPGKNATAPSAPTRTGHIFSGWSGTYTNVTSTRTITATYTINSYTVTFKNWNGSNIVTRTVNHGSNASPPSNPSRTGYTFSGWSGTYTNVTSNRTITATFTINTYNVNFKNWNGTNIVTRTVNYGSNATPPANPTRTGYTFAGWSGTYTSVTSNRDITATFTINSFVVTFKDWNGNSLKTETVNYGSGATAPTSPTRTGYSFAGWDRAFNSITSTTTVTATYSILTYTVTFKDWDSSTLKTDTVNHGSNATAPANPSRSGYTFNGWDKGFTNVISNLIVNAVYTYIPQPALTPSSITYNAMVKGGESLNISWGLSTRATRYHLERSVDGAAYSQIYSGTARVYDDPITKGWLTVKYRVRGYNADGYSAYRTGTNLTTVINFPDIFQNINGTYVAFEASWENVNGTWVETDSIWQNINGTWAEV